MKQGRREGSYWLLRQQWGAPERIAAGCDRKFLMQRLLDGALRAAGLAGDTCSGHQPGCSARFVGLKRETQSDPSIATA
jgi:hypothetical protein